MTRDELAAPALAAEHLASLNQALQHGDVDGLLRLLVQIGSIIRSKQPMGESLKTLMAWIEQSSDARIAALLTYVLGAYAGIPDDLFARVMSSSLIPSKGVPSFAVALTLKELPREWPEATQISFWKQFFSCYPYFFPNVLDQVVAKYHADYPDHKRWDRHTGLRLPIASDLRGVIQTKKVTEPASIDAIFGRVKASRGNSQEMTAMIGELQAMMPATSDRVAAWVSGALSGERDPQVRGVLLGWLYTAPSDSARRALWQAYASTTSGTEKALIGGWLIRADPTTTAEQTFRKLWSQESDQDVRVALIQAVGSCGREESLVELQYAFENGSDTAKEAVREQVELYLLNVSDSKTARAFHERIGPSAHPRVPGKHHDPALDEHPPEDSSDTDSED